ncbi:hypothetical protein ACQPZG_20120 [Streptomyces sp. CA-294286]|uniref:hypothetical protein n=1 Tax=Streptomyces sp. CA-294286 TaxID=3240070 RepID=UPI003D94C37C
MTDQQHTDQEQSDAQSLRLAKYARLIEADLTDALASGFGCTLRSIADRVTVIVDLHRYRIRTQRLAGGRWALISVATAQQPWGPRTLTLILQPIESALVKLLLDVHVRLITAMADDDNLIRYGVDTGHRTHTDDDFEAIVFNRSDRASYV